jgi:hypothetical protein
MKYRIMLAIIGLAAAASVAPANSADTTIKCTCTCKDWVGTFKASCYSTSSCDTCCGFGGATQALRRAGHATFTEASQGALGVVGNVAKDPGPKR